MTASVDPAALTAVLDRLEQRDDHLVVRQSLQRVVDACVELFPIAGSGLMLADDQSDLRYVITSDRPANLLETAQLATGCGPCVDAYVSSSVVTTADVHADDRWPALHDELRDGDVRAVLGLPVRLANLCVGSLDVYRSEPGEWSAEDIAALRQFARLVDTMLATAVAAENADVLATQLTVALETRVPVERAIGYLMARDGVSATDAFQAVRSAARRHRRKVGDVAEQLLSTGELPEEQA